MITSEDKSKIQEISKKYHAKSVLLFEYDGYALDLYPDKIQPLVSEVPQLYKLLKTAINKKI